MRCLALLVSCLWFSAVAVAQPTDPPATDPPPADPPPTPTPTATPAPTPAPAPAPAAPAAPEKLSEEAQESMANYQPASIQLGGYVQPQFRTRQNSPAQFDTEGFRFARARLIAQGQTRAGNLELSAFIEAELQPTFFLADGFVTLGRPLPDGGRVAFDVGQTRVPISRQNLLSDSRLAFVDKGQVATISPGRDLGGKVSFTPPKARQVRVIGGVFNGEGINNIENINEKYLYAGRVEITPIGRESQLAEGGFGGHYVTVAASGGYNKLSAGDRTEAITYLGFDIAGSYRGLSGTFEYLQAKHRFETDLDPMSLPPDFKANGFVAQLNYMLPKKLPPFRQARFEVGARLEEIDRNDTTPIVQPGDPEQSVRAITGVASFYLRSHSVKAQLAVTRFQELEDRTVTNEDARYKNDQVLLQVTYRLE